MSDNRQRLRAAQPIKVVMRELLRAGNCIDPATGIANLTQLAEEAAQVLGHDEWLDDPDHIAWDIAVEVADDLGFGERP